MDGANVTIEYSRPALKGRVPGKDVDPYEGREWRTGADEATTLVTSRALKFGNLSVPAGTYTLRTWQALADGHGQPLNVAADAAVEVGLVVTETKPRVQHADKFGKTYKTKY